jgi:hypothetical protein
MNEMKISCVIWLNVYLTTICPVIRRVDISDSDIDKMSFNNRYRFVVANIPSRGDLIEKERLA